MIHPHYSMDIAIHILSPVSACNYIVSERSPDSYTLLASVSNGILCYAVFSHRWIISIFASITMRMYLSTFPHTHTRNTEWQARGSSNVLDAQ